MQKVLLLSELSLEKNFKNPSQKNLETLQRTLKFQNATSEELYMNILHVECEQRGYFIPPKRQISRNCNSSWIGFIRSVGDTSLLFVSWGLRSNATAYTKGFDKVLTPWIDRQCMQCKQHHLKAKIIPAWLHANFYNLIFQIMELAY